LSPLFGEPTSGGGLLPPALAVLPLHLSLMGDVYPVAGALGDASCEPREEASGNTSWGFPVQHQTYFPLTSRLVLHGFSRLGCPIDASVGGGLTLALPLQKEWWLVVGAGVLGQPSLPRAPLRMDARIDLVMRATSDHPLAIGVGRRGIALTGLW
jgi:hypothetical protein